MLSVCGVVLIISSLVVLSLAGYAFAGFRHKRTRSPSANDDTTVPSSSSPSSPPKIRRLTGNPVVHRGMLYRGHGANISGPSLIRVPSWVVKPLGRYYLYFAHHKGDYIRMAYADSLGGPWRVHRPGVLHLSSVPACYGHIASPDVVIDEDQQEIRMYFHGPARAVNGQKSFVALSSDGLRFSAKDEPLGLFYFRVFRHGGWWYALAKGGIAYRSIDGLSEFEEGHCVFDLASPRTGDLNEPGPRHVAILKERDIAWIFFSRIGDSPERILRARMDLFGTWTSWRAIDIEEVVRPELPWEGAVLPITTSRPGAARQAEHALRDPAVFLDEDSRRYLVYSVAGESGLAIAELL